MCGQYWLNLFVAKLQLRLNYWPGKSVPNYFRSAAVREEDFWIIKVGSEQQIAILGSKKSLVRLVFFRHTSELSIAFYLTMNIIRDGIKWYAWKRAAHLAANETRQRYDRQSHRIDDEDEYNLEGTTNLIIWLFDCSTACQVSLESTHFELQMNGKRFMRATWGDLNCAYLEAKLEMPASLELPAPLFAASSVWTELLKRALKLTPKRAVRRASKRTPNERLLKFLAIL